jgi:hypothetical protein
MATVNLGSIKFNWQGAYDNATAYAVDDVVSSGGNSYVCIAATTGNTPPNATYWELMAQAGTNGTNGTDGTDVGTVITTQGDILYRDGSGLQRLGAGTSGQVLQTGGTGANPSWGTISTVAGTKNFFAYRSATSSQLNNSAETEIVFEVERHDDENVYNTSTGRYAPGVAGTYFVSSQITVNDINGTTDDMYFRFFVNGNTGGAVYGQTRQSGNGASFGAFTTTAVIKLTNNSDYISAFTFHDAGGNRFIQGNQAHFSGFRLT